ncbi:hypothetical protein PMAYCL1PPCAC_10275, partial [Pristionchus mayeri]
ASFDGINVFIDNDTLWQHSYAPPCSISPISPHSAGSQVLPSPVSSWSDNLTDIMEVLEELEGTPILSGSSPCPEADSNSEPSSPQLSQRSRDAIPASRTSSANLPKPRKYKAKPAQVRATKEYK